MRNRKSFFLKNILLTLIFVTLSIPASAFSGDFSPAGDGKMIFVHRDTTIKDSFQPDVFVVFFIVAVSLLFPLLLFLSSSFLERVFGEPINRTKKPPINFLVEFAKNFLPKKYLESCIQEISDMRLEYYEALSEKKIWRARCIVVSYYFGLSWSVVMWISNKIKEFLGIIPKKN